MVSEEGSFLLLNLEIDCASLGTKIAEHRCPYCSDVGDPNNRLLGGQMLVPIFPSRQARPMCPYG